MTKRITLCLAFLLAVSASARPVRADDFAIDNAHSSIIFGVSHLGYSITYGRFNNVSGKFTLDAKGPEASTFQVALDVASIDTNDAKRDEHLKGPDFFNAGEFPVITFKSTKVAPRKTETGIMLDVTGDLTMHGVTKPVTLELQKLGEGPGPGGNDFRTGFSGTAKLKRSDFGMTNMVGPVGDEVAVTISIEGIRKDAAAAPGAAPAGAAPAATGARPAAAGTVVR
jgi:polyisoprenoid-binding protein YceI